MVITITISSWLTRPAKEGKAMNVKMGSVCAAVFLLASSNALATAYNLPSANQTLIGQMQETAVNTGDTTATISQRYDIGYNAFTGANPHVNTTQPLLFGERLQITTQHILPNLPRQGIVINLPEMRMYYYPAGSNQVRTYPIGIGKIGKTIPIKQTIITKKAKDPVWVPTPSIREYNLEQGIVLPRVMPASPDNPLGPYAIYMGIPTYLIHSTIFPESVGKRASFGCIRMYESDIQDFFPSIQPGVQVTIINKPVKVGWQADRLYIEAYHPLQEHNESNEASIASMVQQVDEASKGKSTLVDWQMISFLAEVRDGVPHEVGMQIQ